MGTRRGQWLGILVGLVAIWLFRSANAAAHPLIDDAIDVVIGPDQITVEARVSREEVLVAEGGREPVSDGQWDERIGKHGEYVRRHLRFRVDGQPLEGRELPSWPKSAPSSSAGEMVVYHFAYPLARPPREVRLIQNLLVENDPWTVNCVVRVRQVDQPAFQSDRLTRQDTMVFGCVWHEGGTGSPPARAASPPAARVDVGEANGGNLGRGVGYTLTAYDHLLFIGALVLAPLGIWVMSKSSWFSRRRTR